LGSPTLFYLRSGLRVIRSPPYKTLFYFFVENFEGFIYAQVFVFSPLAPLSLSNCRIFETIKEEKPREKT
jgi:hypothetical protein